MKKSLLLLVLLSSSFFTFSQNTQKIELRNAEIIKSLVNSETELHLPIVKSNMALVEMQVLDSSYYYLFDEILGDSLLKSKYYYEYDTAGRNTLYLEMSLNEETEEFDTASKTEYTYTINPSSFQYIEYTYNSFYHVFNPTMKIIWHYDEQGRVIEAQRYSWNEETLAWYIVASFESDYDFVGNEIYINYMFYTLENVVGNGFNYYMEYDENFNLINKLELKFLAANPIWDSIGNTICEYNEYNLITSFSVLEYDISTQTWLGKKLIENNYNGQLLTDSTTYLANNGEMNAHNKFTFTYIQEQPETVIRYSWNDDLLTWQISQKTEYYYNLFGLTDSIISFNANSEANDWEFGSKMAFEYDDSENIIADFNYFWNEDEASWRNSAKNEYTYDDDGKLLLNIVYYTDYETNDWLIYYKYEYGYDQIGNQLLNHHSNWNSETSEWSCSEFYDYNYNTDFDLNEVVLPVNMIMTQPSVSMIISSSLLIGIQECRITEYYYNPAMIENDVQIANYQEISIFPNPATLTISVVLPEGSLNADFSLFDMQGRCIMEKSIQTESQISISELSNGLYFYKVVVENEVFSGKLIKE
jgi:hypothetical protein